MLERDPQMLRNRLRRRERAPVIEHGVLHPFEIAGIVDMTHEVDVIRIDADGIAVGNRVTHSNVNNIPAGKHIEGKCDRVRVFPRSDARLHPSPTVNGILTCINGKRMSDLETSGGKSVLHCSDIH